MGKNDIGAKTVLFFNYDNGNRKKFMKFDHTKDFTHYKFIH